MKQHNKSKLDIWLSNINSDCKNVDLKLFYTACYPFYILLIIDILYSFTGQIIYSNILSIQYLYFSHTLLQFSPPFFGSAYNCLDCQSANNNFDNKSVITNFSNLVCQFGFREWVKAVVWLCIKTIVFMKTKAFGRVSKSILKTMF